MLIFGKAVAFIKKDFLIQFSYPLSFLLDLVGAFFSVAVFYFLSRLVGESVAPYLESYGGDFFSFLLIGVAFSRYLYVGLNGFARSIRNEQLAGTLEAMITTPTSLSVIIAFSSLWKFVFASLNILVYLLLGTFLFSVDLSKANILAAIIIVLLTTVAFSSLGIISASFIIVFKRGDPINWLVGNLSILLGGVYYPITILPQWLQKFSYLLPLTYSLRAMRKALLQGYSIRSLSSEIIALLIFSVIMIPLSLLIFKYAVRKAKVEGSLIHY